MGASEIIPWHLGTGREGVDVLVDPKATQPNTLCGLETVVRAGPEFRRPLKVDGHVRAVWVTRDTSWEEAPQDADEDAIHDLYGKMGRAESVFLCSDDVPPTGTLERAADFEQKAGIAMGLPRLRTAREKMAGLADNPDIGARLCAKCRAVYEAL